MSDSLDTEYTLTSMALETLTVGLISDLIVLAVIFIQEDNSDRASDREESNDGRDPKRPGVRSEISRNYVRG